MTVAAAKNGTAAEQYDYDLVIIGAGVGGHGAAIHAVENVRILGRAVNCRGWLMTGDCGG